MGLLAFVPASEGHGSWTISCLALRKSALLSSFSGRYRRWRTRAMSLSVSEACAGLGEETFSSVVLIM
jgi:hypothetical protein